MIEDILDLKIINLIDRSYFENIYKKYSSLPNAWKKRNNIEKEILFKNFKLVKNDKEILGGFSISKYQDGYIIETIFSNLEGQGFAKKIINLIIKNYGTYNNIYAFSKNNKFYGFKKLNISSETGAYLFVFEAKKSLQKTK